MRNYKQVPPLQLTLVENKKKRIEKLEKRLDEIENWMLDNSYTHPDFEKNVEERNHISTQLNLV